MEHNENVRVDFIWYMAPYHPEQLGFLDEMSKDEHTTGRHCGRLRKGTCAVQKGVFVRGRRFSAEELLTVDGMVSNTVVEGSMTRAMFLAYLEHSIIRPTAILLESDLHAHQLPLCSPFPGKLSVLCLDNARIHHGEEILEFTTRFGNFQ